MESLQDWLSEIYLWNKSLHVLAIISWMAGMLYLPRLFVYHTRAPIGSDTSEMFKIMERRLMKAIINPAMIVAWITGIALLYTPGVVDWSSGWIAVKILAAIGLGAHHGFQVRWLKAFATDRNIHSENFYRVQNEVPTVFMVIIVIMVIARPF